MRKKFNISEYYCTECDSPVEEVFKDGSFKFWCPVCNKLWEDMDYVYKKDGDDDDIPSGCEACGGPYPHCKTSCKIFDD